MIEFWIIALLLVAFAVVVAIWPLVKGKVDAPGEGISDEADNTPHNVAHFRDQQAELERQVELGSLSSDEGELLSQELEKKLVEELDHPTLSGRYFRTRSAALALVVALVIPVMAVPLYFKLGAQTEMEVVDAMIRNDLQPKEVQSLLERWVARRPDNNQALFMLGGHYMRTGQMEKAVATYRDLVRISNGHPQVVAELAQVLFLKEQNQVTGEVRRLYQSALDHDPQNTTALGLKGIDAFGQEDYSGAIAAWQEALNHEADPAARQSLSTGITKARNLLGQPVAQIRVMVDLAPELAKLPRDARVIVFARPAGNGVQPPVAAVPLKVGDLPREVVLDDSSAMMMGGEPLSSIETLDITARISLSGDVMSADYQVKAPGIKTIDNEVVRLVFTPAG